MKLILQLRIAWVRQEYSSTLEKVEPKTLSTYGMKLDFFGKDIVGYISLKSIWIC